MTDAETMWLIVAGALGLAVILFVVYLVGMTARSRPRSEGRHRAPKKDRPHRDTFRTEEPEPEPLKRAAIIIQGSDDALRTQLAAQCAAAGWDEPLWLEVLDGSGAVTAGTEARRDDVDVVCVRGDANVTRSIASVFAGTQTPVSFLPSPSGSAGAGEDAPHAPSTHTPSSWPAAVPGPQEHSPASAEMTAAMTTALTGKNSRIDIGRARLGPEQREDTGDNAATPVLVFLNSLVIGEVVAANEPALSTKDVAKGIVQANPFTATVKPDDEEEIVRPARSISFSTREQAVTDGAEEKRVLDAYLYASRSLKGWTGVAKAMMRKSSRATPLLVPMCAPEFTITLDKPATLTVDGAELEEQWPAGETSVCVEPLALVVRR
ncbi:MAG: hypothetical protein Q4G67_02580 [Actinomycetia bacterium]|nr:hypothetical protein [Actinomycetes bacterium]